MRIFTITALLWISYQLPAYAQSAIGCYVSRKASLDFFKTKILLKDDSTFYYNFSGDLQFEETTGTFSKYKNKILLAPIPNYDTIPAPSFKEIGITDPDTLEMEPLSATIFDINDNMTKTYIWKKRKLIPISKEGKAIRKARLVRVDSMTFQHTRGYGVWINK